jgi:hypothetical protein
MGNSDYFVEYQMKKQILLDNESNTMMSAIYIYIALFIGLSSHRVHLVRCLMYGTVNTNVNPCYIIITMQYIYI